MESQKKPFRPMTSFERAIVDRLLEPEFPERDSLRDQASGCLVRRYDSHGCFEFDMVKTERSGEAAVVEGEAQDVDGAKLGILLFVDIANRRLACVEFNRWDGEPIIQLPPVDEWKVSAFHS